MTPLQFRSIMAVLWLIAADLQTEPHFALPAMFLFAGYSLGAAAIITGELWRMLRGKKRDDNAPEVADA